MAPCPRCGTDFWPWEKGDHPRKFCSKACQKPPKKMPTPRTPLPLKTCLECCKPFIPKISAARVRCCSKTCRSRYQSKKRKLRLKGLDPTPIPIARIHARDYGRCALCRKPVSLARRYPHPLAATLDHIVPISLGGLHTETNVQLAHARCNLAKSTRPCGSQLRLA